MSTPISYLTLAQCRTQVNRLLQTTATVNAGISNTEIDAALNEWYQVEAEKTPRIIDNGTLVTLGSSGIWNALTTATNIIDVISLHQSASPYSGNPLKKVGLEEIMSAWGRDSTVSTTAREFHAFKEHSDTATENGKMRIMVWPPVAASTPFTGLCSYQPDLLADAADTIHLPVSKAYLICRRAALDLAVLNLGRTPEKVEHLRSTLPEQMEAAAIVRSEAARPSRGRP